MVPRAETHIAPIAQGGIGTADRQDVATGQEVIER